MAAVKLLSDCINRKMVTCAKKESAGTPLSKSPNKHTPGVGSSLEKERRSLSLQGKVWKIYRAIVYWL